MYSQTTGSKFYFTVNMTFETFDGKRGFTATGAENNGDFIFKNTLITGEWNLERCLLEQ